MTKKSSCRLNIRATGGTIVVKHCIQHAGSCVCSCKSVTGKVLCFSRISSSGTLWISHTPPRQSQDNSGRWRREDHIFWDSVSVSLFLEWNPKASSLSQAPLYLAPFSNALKVTSSVKWVLTTLHLTKLALKPPIGETYQYDPHPYHKGILGNQYCHSMNRICGGFSRSSRRRQLVSNRELFITIKT